MVIDAGALDLVANDALRRAGLRALAAQEWSLIIPTATLAEVVTGTRRDAAIDHLVARNGTRTTSEATARRAGVLRHTTLRAQSRRPPSAVDAIVAAHAIIDEASVVLTTDRPDLRRLLAGHPTIGVVGPGDLRL